MQRRLSCIGCCRAVDFVAMGCRAVDFRCAQATGRTAQITGLVVNFKINF
jgi:hypothetical protein